MEYSFCPIIKYRFAFVTVQKNGILVYCTRVPFLRLVVQYCKIAYWECEIV
jgi:hypothetical protein